MKTKSTGSRSPAKNKLKFPNDFLGKVYFGTVKSALRHLKVPGTFLRQLSSELSDVTIPLHSDILIQFRLDRTIRKWLRVASRVKMALVHIEFVDRLRAGLAMRLHRYAQAIREKFGILTYLCQFVVVTGVVKKKKVDRKRLFDGGVDSAGRDVWFPVFYADEFDITKLSPPDQRLLLARIYAILGLTEDDREEIIRVLRDILTIKSEKQWQLCLTLVHAIAASRKHLQPVIYGVLLEEKMEATLTKAETRRLHEMLGAWAERPKNRPFVERKFVRPAVRKAQAKALEKGLEQGRKQGLEQGRKQGRKQARKQTHIGNLLQLLRRNDIKLTEPQKKKLRSLPCEKLPSVEVALDAKSASDFARKAGLNGSGPKK